MSEVVCSAVRNVYVDDDDDRVKVSSRFQATGVPVDGEFMTSVSADSDVRGLLDLEGDGR